MPVYDEIDPETRAEHEELRNICRRNHWMGPTNPPPDWVSQGMYRACRYIIHWRCEKCGTYRHDGIGANGGLLIRRYKYPDWYLRSSDEPSPTSDQLRLWIAKRNATIGFGQPRMRRVG